MAGGGRVCRRNTGNDFDGEVRRCLPGHLDGKARHAVDPGITGRDEGDGFPGPGPFNGGPAPFFFPGHAGGDLFLAPDQVGYVLDIRGVADNYRALGDG